MNKIEEIFKAWNIAFNPDDAQAELAAKRIEICNSCEFKKTDFGLNRCSVCGCALRGKVFSPVKGACPKGKWDDVDGCGIDDEPLSLQSLTKAIDQLSELTPVSDPTPENINVQTNLNSLTTPTVEPKETIFVQIASYRDPQLVPTINDLFQKASKPDNIKLCIAWQHAAEDTWDNLDAFKLDKRIKIIDIPHTTSKGACWARNTIQKHYNNETYTLQLDSHHRFIENWDGELIKMYKGLKEKGVEKPLITSYLPSYNPENDPQERLDEVWKMDFNRFTPEGYIFVYPSTIDNWKSLDSPILGRFFSAHFAFTSGDFCTTVPHDPQLYFHGEEPSLASRAYTHGYDIYHPHKVIAWHFYTRDGYKKHWDDDKTWAEKNNLAHKRFRILHKMEVNDDQAIDIGRYGFGTIRTLEDYEKFAGIRYRDRKVQQYTLDFKYPPNPTYTTVEEYEQSLLSKFKHCIDVHRTHFKYDDYDCWVVSFEMNDGTVVNRQDANEEEISRLLNESKKDEWVRIWREFIGQFPDKWIIWPHSKSEGWVERYEKSLHDE